MAALEQSSLMSRFSERERERELQRSSRRRRRDCKTKAAGRLCVSRHSIGKHGDEQAMLKRTERTLTGSYRWMVFHQTGNLKAAHAEDKPLMDAVD